MKFQWNFRDNCQPSDLMVYITVTYRYYHNKLETLEKSKNRIQISDAEFKNMEYVIIYTIRFKLPTVQEPKGGGGGYHHLTAKGWQRSKQYNMIFPDQFNLMYSCTGHMYPDRTTLLQHGFNSHLVDLKLFSARVEVARTRNFMSS